MDFDNTLVMKGLLFPRRYYFFLGAWFSSSFRHNSSWLFIVNFRDDCMWRLLVIVYENASLKQKQSFYENHPFYENNPVSIARVLWKDRGLLVKIRSTQLGFCGFLKHVGCLIRLFKLYELQKFLIVLSSIHTLKSPRSFMFSPFFYNDIQIHI